MNILEHILAGHYPKDEKGRALVPANGNWTATICATDGPRQEEIVGYGPNSVLSWGVDGVSGRGEAQFDTLLPPPPRKVQHMATLCIPWRAGKRDVHRQPEINLGDTTSNGEHNKEWKYVLLTGETEEPWT